MTEIHISVPVLDDEILGEMIFFKVSGLCSLISFRNIENNIALENPYKVKQYSSKLSVFLKTLIKNRTKI